MHLGVLKKKDKLGNISENLEGSRNAPYVREKSGKFLHGTVLYIIFRKTRKLSSIICLETVQKQKD